MHNENFSAHVHYDDFKGTVAADDLDRHSIGQYLQQKGLIEADEFLAGVKMSWGATQGAIRIVTVYGLLAKAIGFDGLRGLVDSGEPLTLRKIKIDMPLEEFFGCFKQFEIVMSPKGQLDGKDFVS
ncbi:hypothetical protein ACIP1T_08950 [Pseudomonas japonica]|uniref:hypothetical protein n=1 Tax=Pseudomonas japonica TaxID=256466 RepID=UPI00382F7256